MPAKPQPRAYFLTWRTYGSWVPGDERGYVNERANGFGQAFRRPDIRLAEASRSRMSETALELTHAERQCVDDGVRKICARRNWQILALNVRTNHVHVVLGSDELVARVLTALKAGATMLLKDQGYLAQRSHIWARGGSTRILWNERALEAAVDYVLNRQ